jgi:hypothetical protein
MINILCSLWSTLTIGGGKKSKSKLFTYKNILIIDGENIYNLWLIIRNAEINSFGIISTFERMKWKEWSSKNLLKQWNKREKLNVFGKIMWVKIMINILSPLWSTLIKRRGKKCKTRIIYL